jgi:O-acetyl-ADP-ribose deacetylase (regulator of RNase III)
VEFVAQSILDLHVDAIVNAAHSSLRHGGGICDIIHNAAGTRLTDECAKVRAEHGSDYAAGNAAITRAFDLEKNGIKFVVHAVGPNLQDMHVTEKTIFSPRNEKHVTALMDAYKNSLERANERGCQSIALPRISAGIFKFPLVAQALCATRAVNEWIAANPGSSIKKIQFCELPGGVSSKKSNAWLNVYKEFITSGGITE